MRQVGRYQIGEELGRGAMGVVYKAQDPAIGRVVAIKSIRLSDLTDEDERRRMRDRLFREAQSAGVLSHPNIVTIYDIAEEDGMAYIFMEYVNGPTLEKLLGARYPPERETLLSLLRQTAGALDYAHRKGIVHRDIKPANIMVHDNAIAKITDFGVARIASQQMTHSGAMMGTPNYMSPEQVEGHPVDGRADQFSLAVVAYEIFTGEKTVCRGSSSHASLPHRERRSRSAEPAQPNARATGGCHPAQGALEKTGGTLCRMHPVRGCAHKASRAPRRTGCPWRAARWTACPRWPEHRYVPSCQWLHQPRLPGRPHPLRFRSRRLRAVPCFECAWALVGIGIVGIALMGRNGSS